MKNDFDCSDIFTRVSNSEIKIKTTDVNCREFDIYCQCLSVQLKLHIPLESVVSHYSNLNYSNLYLNMNIYFASCMNIIFNELRQQRVKYDVHTTSKIKHTHHFLLHIIFIANLSAILIGTIL